MKKNEVLTTQQVKIGKCGKCGKNNNPSGKGGFKDHPENRNPGGWNPRTTFSYQLNRFKNMTVENFKKYQSKVPESERTMVEELAYQLILGAKFDLKNFKEVADRTEGRTTQQVSINTKTKSILPDSLEELKTNYGELATSIMNQLQLTK